MQSKSMQSLKQNPVKITKDKKNYNEYYMGIALDLAVKSRPSPNPRVGAVIVKNGKITGRGYHHAPGMAHAEVEAINDANGNTKGATIYVTLEPCCHQGRTGPCTTAIVNAGISKVVIGILDPDKNVSGHGVKILKNHCDVTVGILHDQCEQMLKGYIHHRTTGRPLIHIKAAITLDGFIATTAGDSKWITDTTSRTEAHKIRAACDGVIAGINTVIKDDPELTVRLCDGHNPARIILDTNLRISLESKLVKSSDISKVIIAHGSNPPKAKADALKNKNIQLIEVKTEDADTIDLNDLIIKLEKEGMLCLMVEGGAKVIGSFISKQIADIFSLFIAPKFIGKGITWSGFDGVNVIENAITANNFHVKKLEHDILITGSFNKTEGTSNHDRPKKRTGSHQ